MPLCREDDNLDWLLITSMPTTGVQIITAPLLITSQVEEYWSMRVEMEIQP
jgi:hypothetical protein